MPVIGEQIIRLATVDSTNKYAAKALAAGEVGHGTVIVADEQTAGQGQRGRQWLTAPGLDLAMSVVLLPERLPVMAQFNLAKAAALAVHDVVAECLRSAGKDPAEVRIKWPNDILIGRSKVAGMLIANEVHGAFVASAIVGIGMNVNGTGLESTLAATGLVQETGVPTDLAGLVQQLCARLGYWWPLLLRGDALITGAYTAHLWAKDRFAQFLLDGAEFTARPLDVDPSGRLIVEDEAGRVAAYGLERLRFVR